VAALAAAGYEVFAVKSAAGSAVPQAARGIGRQERRARPRWRRLRTWTRRTPWHCWPRPPTRPPAARPSISQISAALKRARRRNIADKAAQIQAALRAGQLGQPPAVTAAYAALVRALTAVLVTLNQQVKAMQGQVETHFGQHPAAEIITSQPGLGPVLGAEVLAEFGDDPARYASAKARKNYAATSPITRASGKKKTALARYVHNDRLIDALMAQAFAALSTSPGARAYYHKQRARGAGHNPALRQLANRLVGILHGCLKPAPRTTRPPPGPITPRTSSLDI
jgi:hypothetical protein